MGDPVEAWCEWIIRMHHPETVRALDDLFAGYGNRPPWAHRLAAALDKCRPMLALPRVDGTSDLGARR